MQMQVILENGDRVMVRSQNGFLAHMDGMEGVIDQASPNGTTGVRFDDGSWYWFPDPLRMNLTVVTAETDAESILDKAVITVAA